MTTGHRHRTVKIRNQGLLRFLRTSLYQTTDRAKVDRSPYPYGVMVDLSADNPLGEIYYLSVLSVLHRWTGLTIDRRD